MKTEKEIREEIQQIEEYSACRQEVGDGNPFPENVLVKWETLKWVLE